MGGGAYYGNVQQAREAVSTTRSAQRAFAYTEEVTRSGIRECHRDLNIYDRIRECCDSEEHPNSTPIAILMDVTPSRGDDAKKIYAQCPAILGSLRLMGIVPSPQIAWGAVGDANVGTAPLQFGQFESDRRIDEYLQKILMNEEGGGTGEESYELMAYALATRTKLDCLKRGKKGFAFFLGDESPYAKVSREHLEKYLGVTLAKDVSTKTAFRMLQKSFHTFLIYPRSTAEERHAAIDTEIRRRLEAAGGRFRDVDIRASLIWENRDDLDLHCLTPGGFEIYYGSKRSHCGGELDVDRNVRGEDPKPVENIRWAKGDAPAGRYQFWVELFAHHERPSNVPFKVEFDINGTIKKFEGHANANRLRQRILVHEFNYDPSGRQVASQNSEFAAYESSVVLDNWGKYIPPANILRVDDANSSGEVILGALALQHGMSFEGFLANMKERKVDKGRRDDVEAALRAYAEQGVFANVEDIFAS